MHVGDIQGALGTIRQHDLAPRTTLRKRLITLLAIMGPGLVVMIGDNDAGGVATYAQAGQNYGTSLLWTLFLLIPVLIVNQEMCVRLGAFGLGLLQARARQRSLQPVGPALNRETWRMPPLAELPRPVWSRARKIGMFTLRGYLLVAAVLLVAKVVQLAVAQPG
jgi:hypothetical protein